MCASHYLAVRFLSRPTNWPLLTIESPVAQWLEHPTRSRRVVGSNPIRGSDFFRVLLIFNLSYNSVRRGKNKSEISRVG